MALVGDGKLAVAEGVPQLDGAVTRTGDDLAVVGGEGDGEDVAGVANEGTSGLAGSELPQAEGLVPRGRQSVGTVGGDDLHGTKHTRGQPISSYSFAVFLHGRFPVLALSLNSVGFRVAYTVRDDVGVTLEAALGVTVGLLVAGKVPDDQGLVATAREQHIGAIRKKHPSQNQFVHVLNQCPKSSKTNVSSSFRHMIFSQLFRIFGIPLLLQRGSQGSNPAIVALKGTTKNHLLSHIDDEGAARGGRRMNAGGAIVVDSGPEIKSQHSRMEEQNQRCPPKP